jgi:excinuclease ABC subunit B
VTLERSTILKELRQGKYDVIVGINLLREGPGLARSSWSPFFGCDKEGFPAHDTR